MVTGLEWAVDAPPALPPRYSLLGVANQINDGERWYGGIEWMPEMVKGGGIVPFGCTGNTDTVDPDSMPALASAAPFVVYASDVCSTFGFEAHDWEGRVRRQLDAVISARVAAELELGTLAQAEPLANHWLTEDPLDVGQAATQSVVAALGDLEMGLAQGAGGRTGFIHVSPAILIRLHAAYALEMSGQRWITPMGNVVVSDAGYTGAPPDGNDESTHQWMYATAPVAYRASPTILNPPTLEDAMRAGRSTNDVVLFAEREVLLQWDPGVMCAETDVLLFTFPVL